MNRFRVRVRLHDIERDGADFHLRRLLQIPSSLDMFLHEERSVTSSERVYRRVYRPIDKRVRGRGSTSANADHAASCHVSRAINDGIIAFTS